MRNTKLVTGVVMCSMIAGIALAGNVSGQNNNVYALSASQIADSSQSSTNATKQSAPTYKDYKRFTRLHNAKLACKFNSTYNPKNYKKDYTIKGTYDLNQDRKKDRITFRCNRDTMKMKLTINGATLKDELPTPETAYVVDVNSKDSYYDLVLYDRGMSDDPTYHFYRYNGKTIKYLGAVGSYKAGAIGFDGKGHVATMDSFLNKLDAPMLKGYYALKKNKWQYHDFDLSKAEQKEYTISAKKVEGYFAETKKKLDKFNPTWSQKQRITLHKGDKITLNKIGDYEMYEVKLEDGRVGVLYFWIGD